MDKNGDTLAGEQYTFIAGLSTIGEERFMDMTTQMAPRIAEAIIALDLPADPLLLNDEQIEALWSILGDIPLNYALDGSTLVPIEGYEKSTSEPCLDEDFWIWPRGTCQQEVWEWFDEHHSIGVAYLMRHASAGPGEA